MFKHLIVLLLPIFSLVVLCSESGESELSSFLGSPKAFTTVHKRLGHYNVEPELTISGISGGASFSMILAFVHSSFIKGVGIMSGAPMGTGIVLSENPFNIWNFQSYITHISLLAQRGLIDDLSNFKRGYLGGYFFHGIIDPVPFAYTKFSMMQLQYYGVKNINNQILKWWATHCWPIPYLAGLSLYGTLCGIGYSGISDMFYTFYGRRYISPFPSFYNDKKHPQVLNSTPQGELYRFDQNEFLPNGDSYFSGLLDFGWCYVPRRCDPNSGVVCKLHFVFHGCQESNFAIILGKIPDFITKTGYLENADANDIILVFPQTNFNLLNLSIGCFDLYGATGLLQKTFATKLGTQPKFVKRLYQRMIAGM